MTRASDRAVDEHYRNASAVAQAWGGVQESIALLALMNELPDAIVEEAGLFMLEACAGGIPEEWDVDIGDLPLLGASPDGILVRAMGKEKPWR